MSYRKWNQQPTAPPLCDCGRPGVHRIGSTNWECARCRALEHAQQRNSKHGGLFRGTKRQHAKWYQAQKRDWHYTPPAELSKWERAWRAFRETIYVPEIPDILSPIERGMA